MRQLRVLPDVDQARDRVIEVDGVLDAVSSYDLRDLRGLLITLLAGGTTTSSWTSPRSHTRTQTG